MVFASDFEPIGKNTYIDKQLGISERERFKTLLEQANRRIEKDFGDLSASPRIIVVSNSEKAKMYGLGKNPAATHIAPWGQYVIIGPKNNGIDVIAHELLHAEVAERLGYWAWQTKFPVWLNEGLAMQVDYRPQYSSDSTGINHREFKKISLLRKSSEFWTSSKDKNIEHYRLAKAAVTEILKHKNKKSMYSMLERVREGADPMVIFGLEKN